MTRVDNKAPAKPAPVSSAEPAPSTALFLIQVIHGSGLPENRLTFRLPEAQLAQFEEKILEFVEELPDVKTEVGRPPVQLIVTAVNKADKTYRGGEWALELGEIISVPDLVSWFNSDPDDKTNASLLRYYLKRHQPFEKYGYTVRALDDFKKSLDGPAKRDYYTIAEANAAWAKSNHREPLQ